MDEPRNKRQEKRDKKKSSPNGGYTSKHVRMQEAIIEKRNQQVKTK
jgi:hypothetical protein